MTEERKNSLFHSYEKNKEWFNEYYKAASKDDCLFVVDTRKEDAILAAQYQGKCRMIALILSAEYNSKEITDYAVLNMIWETNVMSRKLSLLY